MPVNEPAGSQSLYSNKKTALLYTEDCAVSFSVINELQIVTTQDLKDYNLRIQKMQHFIYKYIESGCFFIWSDVISYSKIPVALYE